MDDCFLKNGDPENRQQGTVAAPVKYGIAFLRDAFPARDGTHGTAARPCSGCRRLPCFPSSRRAYPKMPALSKMAGIRGAAAGIRPVCFSVPAGYCQRRILTHSLQAHGRRPQVQILPHSLQAPAPSTTAASARSASRYRSLRPFYSQGRPRWADPSRNRNVL